MFVFFFTPETSGPEITAVDDDEFPGISISAVRPIINEPSNTTTAPDDGYPTLRHLPIETPPAPPTHYTDTYQPMASQSRMMPPVRNYPVSTIGMLPTTNASPSVTSPAAPVNR